MRALDVAAHFVLPAWCHGCERPLPFVPQALGLCDRCRGSLPRPGCGCLLCGHVLPPPPEGTPPRSTCEACNRRRARGPAEDEPAGFDRLVAAWSYLPPIDEVVRRLKYGRLEFLAEDLADGVATAVAVAGEPLDVVAAVPLHWSRRMRRGYDQAAMIAAGVARRLALPYRPLLIRSRPTPPQAALSAARRRTNVANAFRCPARRRPHLRGARVLVIDDVATTGATLDAASTALRAAGALRVVAAVAALTPPGRR